MRYPVKFVSIALLILTVSLAGSVSMGAGVCVPHESTARQDLLTCDSQRAIITYADGVQTIVIESAFAGESTFQAWMIPIPRNVVEFVKVTPAVFGPVLAAAGQKPGKVGEDIETWAHDSTMVKTMALGNQMRQNALAPLTPVVKAQIDVCGKRGMSLLITTFRRAKGGRSVLPPLKIRFKTDKIIFPVLLTGASGQKPKLDLYVCSDKPATCEGLDIKATGKLTAKHLKGALPKDSEASNVLKSGMTVTHLSGTINNELTENLTICIGESANINKPNGKKKRKSR